MGLYDRDYYRDELEWKGARRRRESNLFPQWLTHVLFWILVLAGGAFGFQWVLDKFDLRITVARKQADRPQISAP
jgi:hypothetical protein